MASPKFLSSSKTTETLPGDAPLRIPRLDSLQHRLQHAKDADGQPSALLDELLFFLDDPPAGTADRWQEGADLCASHGIHTSRMSVWRFYRAHILAWRREQNPPPPEAPPDPQETARLHDQARHLAAQRVLEMLNDPHLTPGHLIGLLQNENQCRQIQLARDQFEDRAAVRRRDEQWKHNQRIDERVRQDLLFLSRSKNQQKFVPPSPLIPSHPTP